MRVRAKTLVQRRCRRRRRDSRCRFVARVCFLNLAPLRAPSGGLIIQISSFARCCTGFCLRSISISVAAISSSTQSSCSRKRNLGRNRCRRFDSPAARATHLSDAAAPLESSSAQLNSTQLGSSGRLVGHCATRGKLPLVSDASDATCGKSRVERARSGTCCSASVAAAAAAEQQVPTMRR